MVIVNTVVIVQAGFGRDPSAVAIALGAFGAGSMVAALGLPRLLERVPDRPAMLAGAGLLAVGLALGPLAGSLLALLPLWFAVGVGYSLTQTPGGRLLRRSAHPEDRPAIFAAQFSLSHACWLLTYPLAGYLGTWIGLGPTFLVMALIAATGLIAAGRLWPAQDPEVVSHSHPRLAPDDPHLAEAPTDARGRHAHPFVIDRLHPAWSEGI
jgi:MFS family permease